MLNYYYHQIIERVPLPLVSVTSDFSLVASVGNVLFYHSLEPSSTVSLHSSLPLILLSFESTSDIPVR